jgi:hypothetical protein
VIGDPNGIRTRVTAVKGRCPRPLDDRVLKGLLWLHQVGTAQAENSARQDGKETITQRRKGAQME